MRAILAGSPRYRHLVLALAVATASAVARPVPSMADHPAAAEEELSSKERIDPRVYEQRPQADASGQIRQHIAEKGLTKFAGIRRVGDSLVLFWKGGSPPRSLNDLLDRIRSTGVAVQVRTAAWSRTEVLAESGRLIDEGNARGLMIIEVGPLHDWSGLEVTVLASDLARAQVELESNFQLVFEAGEAARPFLPSVG